MGSKAKRPPLPAATESEVGDGSPPSDDLATEVTSLTEASSYTVPGNGKAIKIPTKKRRGDQSDKQASQASLLIDLYETKNKDTGRPSVRVRVSSGGNPVKVTEYKQGRKSSHNRRVSIEDKGKRYSWEGVDMTHSELSDRGPIEVGINNNISEISSNVSEGRVMQTTSQISDMPPDDTANPLQFKTQSHSRNHSELEGSEKSASRPGKSRELSSRRCRSLSRERRERIETRAAEKVRAIEGDPEDTGRRNKLKKPRPSSNSTSEADRQPRSRRSSKIHSHRDSGDFISATNTESSLRPPDSNLSPTGSQLSKSSLANNPRLLTAVEDAIRRMILPEIAEIKRKQSVHESKGSRGNRDSYRTETTDERDLADSQLSQESDQLKNRKIRRSSKDAATDSRTSRRSSDTSSRDIKESKSRSRGSRHSSRESEGLTTDALKHHDKLSKRVEISDERRERRKKRSHSKSDSRTNSIAQTEEESYDKSRIPPMPMQSVNESDLTRDSILSAETNKMYDDDKPETPIQEVARASPRELPLPESRASTQTPVDIASRAKTPTKRSLISPLSDRSERSLNTARSDRSIRLAAGGLGGAAGALYHQQYAKSDRSERSQSRQTTRNMTTEREISPAQSETSTRKSTTAQDLNRQPEQKRLATASTIEEDVAADKYSSSGRSSPVIQHAPTQKRHPGVNLSDSELHDQPELSRGQARDFDSSGLRQDGQAYRDSQNHDTNRASGVSDWNLQRGSYKDEPYSPAPSRDFAEQNLKHVVAQPPIYSHPIQAQSETGSLLNPSQLSSDQSYTDSPNQSFGARSLKARELQHVSGGERSIMLNDEENASQDRWRFLKQHAQALSGSKEKLQGQDNQATARAVPSASDVKMGASGLPSADDPMPEIGYGHDDDTITNPSLREKQSSILEGPLGDEAENRDHWPYEPTPDFRKGPAWPKEDLDEPHSTASNAALMGAPAGLGIGGGTSGARDMQHDEQREPSIRSQSSASRDAGIAQAHQRVKRASPNGMKDEGYISAAQPRSPDNITPLSFSKPPPTLFGDTSRGYGPAAVEEDPFTEGNSRSAKYMSGNSRGMTTGYFDASTGKGINNIQSQDIVALMDHMSVRDGQRSARDSELIFTLIRSATEMRQNFDQVKTLIEVQNGVNLKNQDKNADRLMSRILGGPKPQVLGSPRTPGGSLEDVPTKKQNIFKRALKGLGSKNLTDVSSIQDMLMQVLDEIETLKTNHANGSIGPQSASGATRGSMDMIQQLQQPADPGYEPEGQAGTGSTPSHSGYFSPGARHLQPQMHSASAANNRMSTNRVSNNRVSTVFEDDGEFEEDDQCLLTPTQESQRERSVSYETPQRASGGLQNFDGSPNTGVGSAERTFRKSNKHTSVPKISRWSKTTEDSGTDNRFSTDTAGAAGRPYSDAFSQESQSGEAVNVIPGTDGQLYTMHDDDRLRSATSLAREETERARSPLIPQPYAASRGFEAETSPQSSAGDPKYNNFKHASLPLQHPQPRQGPTGRHRNHLEDQAYNYGDDAEQAESETGSVDNELFGSVPALARFPGGFAANRRSSGSTTVQNHHGTVSPPSSSQGDQNSLQTAYRSNQPESQAGPAHPPKISIHQAYANPQSLPIPAYSHEAGSPAQSTPSGHSPATTSTAQSSEASLQDEDDFKSPMYPLDSLDRRRSPYMPGGPLAPIEERYSMEGSSRPASLAYSLSQKSRRQSTEGGARDGVAGALNGARDGGMRENGGHSRGHSRQHSANEVHQGAYQYLAQVAEGDERAITPNRSPRLALGADEKGGDVRKLTGPREMPGVPRGTVTRKPVGGVMSY